MRLESVAASVRTMGQSSTTTERSPVVSASHAQKKKLIVKRKPNAELVTSLKGKGVEPQPAAPAPAASALDIPGFPREGRPPSVANYKGGEILSDTTGEIVLRMDRGAFRLLWETMEHTALTNYRKYDTAASSVSEASKRALKAVRTASSQYVDAQPAVIVKRKKLIKASSK
jgi:hypothetical protein